MRLLIVENVLSDESNLIQLCNQQRHLKVVARVETAAAAIKAARLHQPDLVVLDADLIDTQGAQILDSLDVAPEPLAIIVTARPQSAVGFHETNIVDCLTKPVDELRFRSAIGRARARLLSERRFDMPHYLVGEREGRFFFISVGTVDCVRADGNHASLQSGCEQYRARATLKQLLRVLTPANFVRINRSTLVNLGRVAYAEKVGRGVYEFTLSSGERLRSARSIRRQIFNAR